VQQIVEMYLAPAAVRSAKRLMREAYTSFWEDAYARSLPLVQECLGTPEVGRTRAERRK
jgi:hypothetical protein